MSTVKITDLPPVLTINANTANTVLVGVDIPSDVTGQITLTTLARGLYSNNNLLVGNTNVFLPNAVAQFTGNSDLYIQTSIQNIAPKGSGDMVVTADNGTDTTYFIDVGMAGSGYVFAGDDLNKPNDGYIIMAGGNPTDPGGNLSIGTITDGKDINIFQGGLDAANVVATFGHATGLKLNKKPLTFADGTSQNTAVTYSTINSEISSNVATLRGEITSNAASANSVINTRITSNIATVNTFAQAAFNKANNALANTAGVATAGGITINGITSVNVATTGSNAAAMAITGSSGFARQMPAADGYMLHITGEDGIASKLVIDAFGTGSYGLVTGRSARGTADSPTATQNNDVIMRYSSSSYSNGNGFLPLGVGRMDFMATENHTDTNRGTQITFYTINNGANVLTQTAQFNGNTAVFPNNIQANNVILSGSLTANTLAGQVFFSNVSVGSSTANTVQFYPSSPAPTQMPGQLWYKNDVQALVLDTDIANDRPGLGRVIYERVYNGTGSTISANSIVRLQGSVTLNSIPYIALAAADTAANSVVLGIVKNAIANGAYGYSYSSGVVEDINTLGLANSSIIFLSNTPGQMTTIAPVSSTLATIQLGKILLGGTANGKLQIDISDRPEYGKTNGSVIFANNNISVASNTVNINEPAGTISITNGVIQTMRPLAGNQTAFNINFTTDTVVRANISGSNLAITPTNFLAGKEVKVWVTNIAAGNRTITHGCSAVNATGGSTTYTIPANATMFLRYMSFDGDLANTVVSATF